MREQLRQRLRALKTEYDAGQQVLASLEAKKASLRETLLRISGAIQVLEEELAIASEYDLGSTNGKVTEPIAVAVTATAIDVDGDAEQ